MKTFGLIIFLLSAPALAISADTLRDPTRPPPAWLAAQEMKPGKEAANEPPQQPVQLVLTGPTRRFAIVRGELVGGAGKVPNAPRLVELNRNEITIETKDGQETLSIHPGVEMTPVKPGGRPPNKDKK